MKKSTQILIVLFASIILLLEMMGCASTQKSSRVPNSLRDPASPHYSLLGGLYVNQLSCKSSGYDIQITNGLGTAFGMKVGFNNQGIHWAKGEYFPPTHAPVMQYREINHSTSYGGGWIDVYGAAPSYASYPGYYSAGAPGSQFERRVVLKRLPIYDSYPPSPEYERQLYVGYPTIPYELSGVSYQRKILWPGTPKDISGENYYGGPRTRFVSAPTQFELKFTNNSLSYIDSDSKGGNDGRFLITDKNMKDINKVALYNHYLSVNDLLLDAHQCCKIRRPLSARDQCVERLVNGYRPYSPWEEVEVSR